MIKKFFLCAFGLVFTGLIIISIAIFLLGRRELPKGGKQGAVAEALTRKIERAVRLDRWQKTAAVSFCFALQNNLHFRDNQRGYHEVIWQSSKGVYRVHYDCHANFIVWLNESILTDKKEAWKAYEKAYALHTNDFFWLQPFAQLRAPGSKRFYLQKNALLVQYTSGGVTPGDSFLIITNDQGLPIRWEMWVSVLPILKGYTVSFEDWHTSRTGALFSLMHRSPLLDVPITQLKVYRHYPSRESGEKDRFAHLHKTVQRSSQDSIDLSHEPR